MAELRGGTTIAGHEALHKGMTAAELAATHNHDTIYAKLGGIMAAGTSDSAAAPSFTWQGASNAGMYRVDASTLGFATGGLARVTVGSTGIDVVSGGLRINGTEIVTSARVLQNVTADASILTAGTLADERLSGRVLVNSGNVEITGHHAFRTTGANDTALGARYGIDWEYRARMTGGGALVFGDGRNEEDTKLYRSAAATLKTDGAFKVGTTLTVGSGATIAADGDATFTILRLMSQSAGIVVPLGFLDLSIASSTHNNGIVLRRSSSDHSKWANIGMSSDTELFVGVNSAATGIKIDNTGNVRAPGGITFGDGSKQITAGGDSDPVGTYKLMYGTASPGEKWVAAEGQVLPQSEYPDLFAVVGLLPAAQGNTWTPVSKNPFKYGDRVEAAALGDSAYVVVLADKRMFRSVDGGTTWTPLTLPVGQHPTSGTVLMGNSGDTILMRWSNNLLRSTDAGATWTTLTNPTTAAANTILYGGGVWLMLLTSGATLYRSTDDGTTWQTATTPSNGYAVGVLGGTRWVIAGTSGRNAYSDNGGATWTAGTSIGATVNSIAFGAGMYVAGANGTFYSSANGTSWTSRLSTGLNAVHGLAFAETHFVAQNYQGNVYRSVNGTAWSSTLAAMSGVAGVSTFFFGVQGNTLVYLGETVVTSQDDGATWTALQARSNATVYDAARNPETGTILIATSDGLFRSSDGGTTWRGVHSGARACAYGGGVWIACAWNSGNLYRSTDDGVTWTTQVPNTSASSVTSSYRATLAFGNGVWVVGHTTISYSWDDAAQTYDRSTNAFTYTSQDGGITWTYGNSVGCPLHIQYVPGLGWFAANIDGYVYTSTNGTVWTAKQMPGYRTNYYDYYATVVSLAVEGTTMYALNELGDVYTLTQGASSWERIVMGDVDGSDGRYYALAKHRNEWVATRYEYNGGLGGRALRLSSDGGKTWWIATNSDLARYGLPANWTTVSRGVNASLGDNVGILGSLGGNLVMSGYGYDTATEFAAPTLAGPERTKYYIKAVK